jgi:phosphoglycolate phosphatase-like HAD superfamily hydrolase
VPRTALLDVDGTLIDTNYHHALAWFRAFRDEGLVVPVWRVHRHIGMGGDQLVGAVADEQLERRAGDSIREAHSRHYGGLIDDVEPMGDARRLIEELAGCGYEIVLASSAKEHEVEHYRQLLDAERWIAAATTSADVETTKPAPDLIESALERSSGDSTDAVLVGDSTWDCESAGRAGVATAAVLTGGFSESELRDAGAVAVYESLGEVIEHLGEPPFA